MPLNRAELSAHIARVYGPRRVIPAAYAVKPARAPVMTARLRLSGALSSRGDGDAAA